jgi:hypothetical protein
LPVAARQITEVIAKKAEFFGRLARNLGVYIHSGNVGHK